MAERCRIYSEFLNVGNWVFNLNGTSAFFTKRFDFERRESLQLVGVSAKSGMCSFGFLRTRGDGQEPPLITGSFR